jgi:hypothetical protein
MAVARSVQECFTILTDPSVQMGITVQQMVMSAARDLLAVRSTASHT